MLSCTTILVHDYFRDVNRSQQVNTSPTKTLQNEAFELYATLDYSIEISDPNKKDSKRKTGYPKGT